MRAGRIGLMTASAVTVLLVAGCSQPAGIAGVRSAGAVSAESLTTPSPTPSPTPSGPVKAPEGDDPVRVPPPKLSKYTYAFPVEKCKVSYQRKLLVLPKTTIWAKRGCVFVAPIDGVVHEVSRADLWQPGTDLGSQREGRFVSIIGEDGVRYLGGHLDSVAEGIEPGVKVKRGQELGRVGTSGNARETGSNLYFAISWKTAPGVWWVRRGMVEPWDYLDAWRNGNRTYSPRKETLDMREEMGETPPCKILCGTRQAAPATTTPTPKPTKKRVRATPTPDEQETLQPTSSVGMVR